MSTISDRLRELRGASSQTEMATAVNVKQQNWARWESGAVAPSAEMLATICRVHACSADWLLGLRASAPPREAVPLAAGDLPQCARCEYRKLADKARRLFTS